jgi:hypothetical protein
MTRILITAMLAAASQAVKQYYYTYSYYSYEPSYYSYDSYSYSYYYTEPTYYSYDSYSYYYTEPTYYSYDSYSYSYTDSYSYSDSSYSGSSTYSGDTSTSTTDVTPTTAVVEPEVLPELPEEVPIDETLDELLEDLMECKKTMTIEEVRAELEACRLYEYESQLLVLASKWVGYYQQHGENHEMEFEELFIGETPMVIGQGTDGVDDFTLDGTRDGDDVVFEKVYDSISSYYMIYTGELSQNSSVVEGTWQIFDEGDVKTDFYGNFKLTKQYASQSAN